MVANVSLGRREYLIIRRMDQELIILCKIIKLRGKHSLNTFESDNLLKNLLLITFHQFIEAEYTQNISLKENTKTTKAIPINILLYIPTE